MGKLEVRHLSGQVGGETFEWASEVRHLYTSVLETNVKCLYLLNYAKSSSHKVEVANFT